MQACKSPKIITKPEAKWESSYSYEGMDEWSIEAHIATEKFLLGQYDGFVSEIPRFSRLIRIDNVHVNREYEAIRIVFNNRLSDFPIRPNTIAAMDSVIRTNLPETLQTYRIDMYSMGVSLEELIPNYYLSDSLKYITRLPLPYQIEQKRLVRNLDRTWESPGGLDGRHVALWHSHGWYYNQNLGRWKWQRPRLFLTVEDLFPMMFTLPYIVPMLEAAGAHVWLPRERDTNHHMAIVDNDAPSNPGRYQETQSRPAYTWQNGLGAGFAPFSAPLRDVENPFRGGTFRTTSTDSIVSASINWSPEIPESGYYAVYISYASTATSTQDARYTVYHTGGETRFSVDQTAGGGTWIYLGKFHFDGGQNAQKGAVVLENISDDLGKTLTADAVRFGGGMGINERGGRTSDRPRFVESARYNLQFAGFPDTLVWKLNQDNDYSDDFQSRGEWVNYLRGNPFGPNRDRTQGLGIPIDLSLAFHTDAGVTRNDTVIGTLAIYSVPGMDQDVYFPDGVSRMANRDLTDLMQTQIVDDIRAIHDSTWVRRALRNSQYSEAMRPNVPSVLLELLSHQNFRDMQFGLDPQFRFDVSRSIYKSMVRFVATQYGYPYVIQPLPVTHIQSTLEGDAISLQWKEQPDPLEPTAMADAYIVYIRTENGGFDNGRLVRGTSYLLENAEPGVIYSFKVRASNAGGEGFPSEIVSAMIPARGSKGEHAEPVLIINGFTRISAPAVIKSGAFQGFASFLDAGVPDRYELGFTGEQYNFGAFDDWIENDRPGHGASHSDMETQIIAGNSHDFAIIHGQATRSAGFGFVSTSLAAVEDSLVNASRYNLVNLILGNQREVPKQTAIHDTVKSVQFGIYSSGVRQFLTQVAVNGGGILVSGAHVGTDLNQRPLPDSLVSQFANQILGYDSTTNHASRTGEVIPVAPAFFQTRGSGARSSVNDGILPTTPQNNRVVLNNTQIQEKIRNVSLGKLQFNTHYDALIYRVDAPDAIKPALPGSATILRYRENDFSAGVAYAGHHRTVILGFPFETILSAEDRARTMQQILKFLE